MKTALILVALVLGGLPSGGSVMAGSVDRIEKISCSSKNFKRKECRVKGNIKAVLLLEQKSDSECVEGRSFGFSDDYIWVDQGCSGKFEVSHSSNESSWWRGWGSQNQLEKHRISCKSKNFQPNTCRVEGTIHSLTLHEQKSDSACTFGVSYGYRDGSVWVSKGCEASFDVEYEPGASSNTTPLWGRDRKEEVKCESKKNKRRTCRVDGPIASLQLHKQKSTSPCIEGESYGFSGDTIWVDKGCRAEFRVEYRRY